MGAMLSAESDIERQQAATANTPYYIASITKTITATALMRLPASQKKVDLDQPVNTYLRSAKIHQPHVGCFSSYSTAACQSHGGSRDLWARLSGKRQHASRSPLHITAIQRYGCCPSGIRRRGVRLFEPWLRGYYKEKVVAQAYQAPTSIAHCGDWVFAPLRHVHLLCRTRSDPEKGTGLALCDRRATTEEVGDALFNPGSLRSLLQRSRSGHFRRLSFERSCSVAAENPV